MHLHKYPCSIYKLLYFKFTLNKLGFVFFFTVCSINIFENIYTVRLVYKNIENFEYLVY